jgi:hypothetical protein
MVYTVHCTLVEYGAFACGAVDYDFGSRLRLCLVLEQVLVQREDLRSLVLHSLVSMIVPGTTIHIVQHTVCCMILRVPV